MKSAEFLCQSKKVSFCVVAIVNVGGGKHNIAGLAEMICEKLSCIREKLPQLM